ncbi:MAG: heavy metal translocating P-type ATPase [Dongiaceae bacterium]
MNAEMLPLFNQPASAKNVTEIGLRIGGMHCAACASAIQKNLLQLPGVSQAEVQLALRQGRVRFDPGQATPQKIISTIQKLGYSAEIDSPERHLLMHDHHQKPRLWRPALALLGAAFLLVNMVFHFLLPEAEIAIAAIVQFIIGAPFFTATWRDLKNRRASMDSLVTLGASAAFILSLYLYFQGASEFYFETGAVVIAFVLLGRYLEARAFDRAEGDILNLHHLLGDAAMVERGRQLVSTPLDQIKNGDVVVVGPGERVPVDGVILQGKSALSQAWLTGESLPVVKEMGDQVLGGAVNGNGTLKIKVTAAGVHSKVGQLTAFVRSAAGSKAPIERILDKVIARFVPSVLLLALITLGLWAAYDMWMGNSSPRAFMNALSVLMVACPCALGLAAPMVVLLTISTAARHGLLIKNAAGLEKLGSIDTLVLDKTGTLTQGRPQITDIVPATQDAESLLRFAASAQRSSRHPLSQAAVEKAASHGMVLSVPTQMQEFPGQGLIAEVMGRHIIVGSRRFLSEHGFDLNTIDARAEALAAEGKTLSFIGEKVDPPRLLGLLALRDELRPSSRETIQELQRRGFTLHLLTGDNRAAAERIAREVGISDVEANILPEEKAGRIASLKMRGRHVAMVGDGINDAPALSVADVGMALGDGADITMEAADIGLLKSDPAQILSAIKLGNLYQRKIWENLLWAFGFNILALPLAVAGVLTPMMAGLAMTASSLLVVANASLIRKWRG